MSYRLNDALLQSLSTRPRRGYHRGEQMQHLIDYLFVVLLIVVPMWRILRRAGFSRYVWLMCFVPVIAFAVLAFVPWRASGVALSQSQEKQ